MDATAASDAAVALSLGAQTAWSGLAAIVRFNTTGTIDARNGGAYAATATVPYTAGTSYHVRFVVNVAAHTYAAYVRPSGGSETQIASAYGFRTEQATVTSLNNWVAATDGGALTVCNFVLTPPDTTAPTVSMTAPAAGATVSGTIPVSANASDNVGVAGVQFLVDGANAGAEDTTAPFSISYNTAALASGSHSFSARARDAAGNTATAAAVTVTVTNVECYTATAGGGWVNDPFDVAQTGSFTATFDARPSVGSIDSVVGISNGPQTTYPGFACLARFNASGNIDARNGGAYAAAATIPYAGNSTYHFRLVVNVPAHTYSIYVTPPGGTEQTVGLNYAVPYGAGHGHHAQLLGHRGRRAGRDRPGLRVHGDADRHDAADRHRDRADRGRHRRRDDHGLGQRLRQRGRGRRAVPRGRRERGGRRHDGALSRSPTTRPRSPTAATRSRPGDGTAPAIPPRLRGHRDGEQRRRRAAHRHHDRARQRRHRLRDDHRLRHRFRQRGRGGRAVPGRRRQHRDRGHVAPVFDLLRHHRARQRQPPFSARAATPRATPRRRRR